MIILIITRNSLIVHKHQGEKTSTIFTQSSRKGLHDRIVSLPAVNQQSHSSELPLDDADEIPGLPSVILPDCN